MPRNGPAVYASPALPPSRWRANTSRPSTPRAVRRWPRRCSSAFSHPM
jgi:hypothetical protein